MFYVMNKIFSKLEARRGSGAKRLFMRLVFFKILEIRHDFSFGRLSSPSLVICLRVSCLDTIQLFWSLVQQFILKTTELFYVSLLLGQYYIAKRRSDAFFGVSQMEIPGANIDAFVLFAIFISFLFYYLIALWKTVYVYVFQSSYSPLYYNYLSYAICKFYMVHSISYHDMLFS